VSSENWQGSKFDANDSNRFNVVVLSINLIKKGYPLGSVENILPPVKAEK
jgi:hypothetical protein